MTDSIACLPNKTNPVPNTASQRRPVALGTASAVTKTHCYRIPRCVSAQRRLTAPCTSTQRQSWDCMWGDRVTPSRWGEREMVTEDGRQPRCGALRSPPAGTETTRPAEECIEDVRLVSASQDDLRPARQHRIERRRCSPLHADLPLAFAVSQQAGMVDRLHSM